MAYEKLLSPIQIGNCTIRNRVALEPMLLGVGEFDGTPGEKMIAYYEERAKGGAGLIITEVTRISEFSGATGPMQLAVTSDRHIEPLSKLAEAIHRHDSKLFVQLHHPGRQNLNLVVTAWMLSENIGRRFPLYWKLFFSMTRFLDFFEKPFFKRFYLPVPAPSPIPTGLGSSPVKGQTTRAITRLEIKRLINNFIQGARRVKEAGCDGVQLHASHGYLIQQFLSPYTNKRTDEYGGSFENRLRFLSEIISGIRKTCGPDFPIMVRLTVDEFYASYGYPQVGLRLEEGVRIAKALEQMGIDAIDVSSGTYDTMNSWLEPTSFAQGWRKYLAKAVKDEVDIPVLAASVIRTPEQAEEQINEGCQDMIGLGRPLLADPYWVRKAEEGRPEDIQRCISCLWCIESMYNGAMEGVPGECAVNPRSCKETEYPLVGDKNGNGRVVVIAGGGPAGLTAARVLAEREFKVVLFEKEKELGGQLQLANKPPLKEKIGWAIDGPETALKKLGVEIRLNTEANYDNVSALSPYAVIDATGGSAIHPPIPGADASHVCTLTPVLDGSVQISGKKVAVIGSGMSGLETAEFLVANGNEVMVVEMEDCLAPGTWQQHIDDALMKLEPKGTIFLTGRKLVEIRGGSILLEPVSPAGPVEEYEVDQVVMAVGVCPNGLDDAVKGSTNRFYAVGDACEIGKIANATHSAYKVAMGLK